MSNTMTLQNPEGRWNMVATLTPRLKSHIHILRHQYRGEISYVLEDSITRQQYRFSQGAYEVVGRMTGQYSCEKFTDIYRVNLNIGKQKKMVSWKPLCNS